jgi:general secretion pathway protein K
MSKIALKNENGIALFMVLWVLMLLSVIVGEFCYAMRTEVNVTRNFKQQTEGYYIALGGLNKAISELVRNEFIPEQISSSKDNDSRGNPFAQSDRNEKQDEEVEKDESRWRINHQIPPIPLGKGRFEVIIGNESGKLNINEAGETLLKTMLKNVDIEQREKEIIVDSILDWRDKNNLHRLNGAEDDYYRSLEEPYECKDADFDTVEELMMVKGVTREIYLSRLKDMVTVSKTKGTSSKKRRGYRKPGGYRKMGAEMNKININAASKAMLLSLPSMTEDLAQLIIDFRKEADFKSLTDISALLGSEIYNDISPYITLDLSPFYTITSVGKLTDSRIRRGIEVMVEIGKSLKSGYRIVKWRDRVSFE